MNKEQGLLKLTEVIKGNLKHRDYKRVTKLADEYYKMVSGDGISDLLRRIVKRETEEEFEMRKTITNSIIPPTLASTKLPFQKTVRTKPKKRDISWEGKDDEKKKDDFEQKISAYWGDASLEKFLEYAFVDYNYIDPNAFLITEFDEFDPRKEKAKPYPFIATSDQCVMFETKNNILEYLVVKLPIKYKVKQGEEDGSKYTIYLGMDTITFTQVDNGYQAEQGAKVIEIEKNYYLVQMFTPKNEKVPARRFGYKRDPVTQGRTYVSVFHDVIPYLNKTLKTDSELDLSTAMTAFPQRFEYVTPCNECGGSGVLKDGKECGICHGTGRAPVHNSTMDVITLDLPRNKEEMIDLENMLVYKSPPIDLLTFQKDYINELRANVFLMMFNKELLDKADVAATATEKVLDIDYVNDTLNPFARSLSTMWEFVVKDIATYTDFAKGLWVDHEYPEDFKFKSMTEMMRELQGAKDANASTSTIAKIEDDINEKLYADQPYDLKVIRIKNSFNPFRGYKEETINLLISQNLTTKYNATLYANLESIFNELEQETQGLYELNYILILEKVKMKVAEYMAQMEGEKPKPPVVNFPIEEEPEEDGGI